MRALAFIICILGSLNLLARTEGRFLGQQYMINMISFGYDGTVDFTPHKIFRQMNVSEQSSLIGPGKVLETAREEISFICSKKKENDYHCSVIIFNSAFGKINFKSASLKYTGEKAQSLYAQFFPNDDGSEIVFQDDTGQFKLLVQPDLFQLTFNAH